MRPRWSVSRRPWLPASGAGSEVGDAPVVRCRASQDSRCARTSGADSTLICPPEGLMSLVEPEFALVHDMGCASARHGVPRLEAAGRPGLHVLNVGSHPSLPLAEGIPRGLSSRSMCASGCAARYASGYASESAQSTRTPLRVRSGRPLGGRRRTSAPLAMKAPCRHACPKRPREPFRCDFEYFLPLFTLIFVISFMHVFP